VDINQLRDIAQRERQSRPGTVVRCCVAAGCLSSGSGEVVERLKKTVESERLGDRVRIAPVGCMRLCSQGPLVQVDPTDKCHVRVRPDQAEALLGVEVAESKPHSLARDDPFFAKQASVILENCGHVEPERIETYLAANGYEALHRTVLELQPADVIDLVARSGLRGRGGAGYPTGVKWGLVAKSPGPQRYVVCNADEGDPGAFMNRSVLESDPHSVIEGMAIAGYAVGANHGYIYVRAEYTLAIARLQQAIHQASHLNLLGSGIFSSAFDFKLEVRVGGGAFVCGEETALMASIMGGRGIPTPRPPYPAEHGLWGCPTLLNNVETFANIPKIVRNGPEWFAAIGTPTNPGTKVFCLTGQIANAGLVEVPLGTPLRTIVEDIGGGAPHGKKVKAVQTGGPSGGCIPAQLLDTPVDYDSLAKIGSIMGSGGMIVLDESTDMVDIARFFMQFCRDESCGKCVPCRAGTVQMHGLLTKILDGKAHQDDLARLERLCDMVGQTSLCGLGQTAPNPTMSTLRHFRSEFEERLIDPPAVGEM
jgi:bidirectional [NiFe] hydrogenase diaphorase subunit